MGKGIMDIGVVIVTFNRVEKLKTAWLNFDVQSILPAYIIVVDNASSDETPAFLGKWENDKKRYMKKVIRMNQNKGGSGGFYTGLQESLKLKAQWIWVSDDDAFPEADALEIAQKYLTIHKNEWENISAICGQVINQGQADLEHRRSLYTRGVRIKEWVPPLELYKQETFQINTFSYVGTIINQEKMEKAGLTRKEYFIWFDDTEHGLRLGKLGKIVCIPNIKIHHDVNKSGNGTVDWRCYYRYRNMTDCYRRNFPRRCYLFFYMKAMIKVKLYFLFGMEKAEREMLRCGLEDARNGKFGLHEVYRPGWKLGE